MSVLTSKRSSTQPSQTYLLSGYMRDRYRSMPLDELMSHFSATETLPQRIELLRAAVTREDVVLPSFRADLLDQLGVDLLRTESGDRAENQEEAIDALQAALRVLTDQEEPDKWSTIQLTRTSGSSGRPDRVAAR